MVGSLSFDVQEVGGGSHPIWNHSDRQKKRGGWCKNWTFFMDVINVWSLKQTSPHFQFVIT